MAVEELVREALAAENGDAHVAVDPWQIIRLGRRRRTRRVVALLATSMAAVLAFSILALAWIIQPDFLTSKPGPAAGGADEQPAIVVAYEHAQRSWVDCLRSHGTDVSDPPEHWPYPRLDAQLHRLKGQPVYEAAQAACSSLVPEVTPDLERAWGQTPSP